jgi:hypothetical protein
MFREIKLANSTLGRYRISILAHWFWCAEQAYWQARGTEDNSAIQQKETGKNIHATISEKHKRWTWEIGFLKKLEQFRQDDFGFVRKVGKENIFWDITGHPDEFQVTIGKKVSIVEIKTTEMGEKNLDFFIHFRLPCAVFQTQLYCYILDPILKEIDYDLDHTHVVQVWHVKYRREQGQKILVDQEHLCDFPVLYYPVQVENQLLQILEGMKDHSKVIKPRSAPTGFKCRQCPKNYKEKCQFWKSK